MSKNLIKTEEQIKILRKSGVITAKALKVAIESAKPGVTLLELDKIAEDTIIKNGGESSFKTVPGYDFTTCLTLNDEVVHGTPRDIKLKEGDILGIDVGALFQGWHTDVAWSIIVGGEKNKFLEVGEKTLWETINKAHEGKRIGDISATIQENIESAGYNVVKSFSGHGVGRQPHEEPEIPTFGKIKTGLKLKKGMILAIEVIYVAGSGDVYEDQSDGWTIVSSDHSLGGLFEMSVIVGKNGAEVLTDWRKI
ncbi:MAG: type I methionyl aminopeptidase [Candidatus Daviesbacteria bacterium]|nr:type I methionyl aminopeptidase [Candidatus Daviesbacteria bacterium]